MFKNPTLILILAFALLISGEPAHARGNCTSDFLAVSYGALSDRIQASLDDLGSDVLKDTWQADECVVQGFDNRWSDYSSFWRLLATPAKGVLLHDTSRDWAATVANGEEKIQAQEIQFVAAPEDIAKNYGIHPNFLHDPDKRTIFVGMAWIDRQWKCYPGWPAATKDNSKRQAYCVEEPGSDDEPFIVKFVAGENGAPIIGVTLKLSTEMKKQSEKEVASWFADRLLPAVLVEEDFKRLMEQYVVVSHSKLRGTRKVRFVFVDKTGHSGPESTPEDPLPAHRRTRNDDSNGAKKRQANICGSASQACPMMTVPGNLIAEMRSGTIDFSRFEDGFFK